MGNSFAGGRTRPLPVQDEPRSAVEDRVGGVKSCAMWMADAAIQVARVGPIVARDRHLDR